MPLAIREDLLPQPGDTIAGQYRVEQLLGHGGMGAVFAGAHLRTGRAIAIKWMLPQAAASKEAVQRFIAEARATARIEHPNVVHIYDFGEDRGSPFLVMERLRGESLRERLDQVGRLAPADAVRVMLPAMRGVAEAHREAIIHRDLKPDNIFLCRGKDGSEREAKVVDFGISKLYDNDAQSNLTGTGMMMGTPAYMSPEQLNAPKDADVRFDVYALGVVFYETLAGRLPYDAEGIFQLVGQIMSADPPPIRHLAPDVPPELEAAVLRAMHRDPDARFGSMEEMIAAVEAARRAMLGSSPGLAPVAPASTPPPGPPGVETGRLGAMSPGAHQPAGFAPTTAAGITPPGQPAVPPTGPIAGATPRSIPPTALGTPARGGLKRTEVLPEVAAYGTPTPTGAQHPTGPLPVGPTDVLPALDSNPGVVGAAGTPFEAFGPAKPKRSTGKVVAVGALALLLGALTAAGLLLYVLPKRDEGRAAAAAAAPSDAPAVTAADDSSSATAEPAAPGGTPGDERLPDGVEPPAAVVAPGGTEDGADGDPQAAQATGPDGADATDGTDATDGDADGADGDDARGDDAMARARRARRRARRRSATTPAPRPLAQPAPAPVVTRPPPRPRTEQGANGALIIE